MIFLPELVVEDILTKTLDLVAGDPLRYAEEIFANLDDTRKAAVIRWLSGGQLRDVKVERGYPGSPPNVPGLYILVAAAEEARQYIGDSVAMQERTETTPLVEWRGATFQVAVRVLCIAPSADWTTYLQALAFWGLLAHRDSLQEAGLVEQTLSMADLAPLRELEPDVVFSRDVVLRGKCEHTWAIVYQEEFTDVGAELVGDDYRGAGQDN